MCWTDLDKNTYGVNRELHGSGKEGRARERIKLQTCTRKKKKKKKTRLGVQNQPAIS